MDRAQILWLLNYLSGAYRNFKVEEEEAKGVVNVWLDILRDVPFEAAESATRRLCQINPKYAPTPAEIYLACMDNGTDLTVYQIQQQEQQQRVLELQDYHDTEKVGPMPDHIRVKLGTVSKKVKVVSPDEP